MKMTISQPTPLSPMGAYFHQVVRLLERDFLLLLIAVTIPFVLSYGLFLLGAIVLVNDVNTATSLEELKAIAQWSNPSLIYALMLFAVSALCSLIGLVAAPLATLQPSNVTWRTIFVKSLRYVPNYLALLILLGLINLLLTILSYLFVFIILLIVGLINSDWLDFFNAYVGTYVPLLVVTFGLAFFTFAPFFIIDKTYGAIRSLKESFAIVQQNFFPLLGRFIILAITLGIISFILQFIPIIGPSLAVIVDVALLAVCYTILYRQLVA